MKIVIAVANDLSRMTGSSIHVLEIACYLSRLGHEVVLFCYKKPDNGLSIPVDIRSFPLPRIRILAKLLFYIGSFFYLTYMTAVLKWDIIYTRIHMRFLAPAIAARVSGRPLVVEVNGYVKDELRMLGVKRPTMWFARKVEETSYKFAKKIITVTRGLKDVLYEDFPSTIGKIVVVPNGVNAEVYKPINQEYARGILNLDSKAPYVLFLGYLAKWQGIEVFLDSFPPVLTSHPEVRFLIVGTGPEEGRLKAKIEGLANADQIIFVGEVSQEEAVLYINSVDVCVAPFTSERNSKIGLSPLKLYSYMACRKAVVASDIQGVGDFIREADAGIAVRPDDPQELSSAILHLLADETLRNRVADAGYFAVHEKHTWEKIAREVNQVISEAVIRE